MIGFLFFRDKNLNVTLKPEAVTDFRELVQNEITGAEFKKHPGAP